MWLLCTMQHALPYRPSPGMRGALRMAEEELKARAEAEMGVRQPRDMPPNAWHSAIAAVVGCSGVQLELSQAVAAGGGGFVNRVCQSGASRSICRFQRKFTY